MRPDPLASLTADKTRHHETSNVELKASLKKFVVVEHGNSSIISSPGFYETSHGEEKYSHPQNCFECKSPTNGFYRALTRISGKYPAFSNILFCADHVPATKKAWQEKLMGPDSGHANKELEVQQYFIVGQGIPKPEYDYPAAAVRKITSSVNGFFTRINTTPVAAVAACAAIVGAIVYNCF